MFQIPSTSDADLSWWLILLIVLGCLLLLIILLLLIYFICKRYGRNAVLMCTKYLALVVYIVRGINNKKKCSIYLKEVCGIGRFLCKRCEIIARFNSKSSFALPVVFFICKKYRYNIRMHIYKKDIYRFLFAKHMCHCSS